MLSDIWLEGSIVDSDSGIDTTIDTTSVQNASAALQAYTKTLAILGNSFDVPAGAKGVIIEFEAACTTDKSINNQVISSIGNDVGAFLLLLGTGVTTLTITSTGNDTGATRLLFF